MKRPGAKLLPALTFALIAVMALANATVAQSNDKETITMEVMPFACEPVGAMFPEIQIDTGTRLEVPYHGTSAPEKPIRISMRNANCEPWTITAELGDFTLTTDTATMFPASTLSLISTNISLPQPNPQARDDTVQPSWVLALPADLDTGGVTMPVVVTFSGSPVASGSAPLLSSSTTAAYASPGNWSGYYMMHLDNVPSTLPAGTYEADFTITVQGPT